MPVAERLSRVDRRALLKRIAPCFLLFVISMAMTAAHVKQYDVLSPIDELRHVDYMMRVTEFELPKLGDLLHQEAMRTEACRGGDLPEKDQPCGLKHYNPRGFRDKGYQTATAHPPTYYVVVGFIARAMEGIGLFHDLVDPARLMGGVLLFIGLLFTYFAGVRLGVRKGALVAACALVPTASAVMHASSTVNPDSAAVLAGGVVLLAAVKWEQGDLSMPWLIGAGALAGGIKFTNLLIVLVVAGWLLARSPAADRVYDRIGVLWHRLFARADDDPREEAATPDTGDEATDEQADEPGELRARFPRAAAAILAGGVAVVAAWAMFDRLRATIDPAIVPQNQALKAHGFPAAGVILSNASGIMTANVFTWFPPVDGYDPVAFQNAGVRNGRLFVFFIFAAAMLVACLRATRRDRILVLGTVGSFVAIFGAPAFLIMNVVVSDVISAPTGRFGMSLFPVFVLVLAAWVRTRAATLALALVAAIIYITQFVTILSNDVPGNRIL